ncbi:MAG: MarR family EPS-associated transcriptional regulator, partial [Porticoccaceae bacterium]
MSQQELEYKVLNWLEKNPNITQRQLAKELGVSLGKAHYLINSLIQVGWVKLDNFKRSDNKMGYIYLLTP